MGYNSQNDVESGKETEMENKAMAKVSGSHPKGGFMQTPLRYGTSEGRGTAKAKIMVKGPDGKPVPNYAVDGDGSKDLKKSSPGKFDEVVLGGNKGDNSKSKPGKTDYKK